MTVRLFSICALVCCACATTELLPSQKPVAGNDGQVSAVAQPTTKSDVDTSGAVKGADQAGMCFGADKLAKCLAAKGVKLYGNCYSREFAELARAFGPATKDLSVVMCMTCMDVYMTNQECIDKKIVDYPTWIFPGGKRIEGRQHLPTIAAAAGCKY